MLKIKIVLIISLLSLVSCTTSNVSPTGNTVKNINDERIVEDNEYIRIKLSDITKDMEKYTYDSDGTKVSYLVMRSSDGEVRTAFDACDVCGGYKGYSQKGNDVICNNCGRAYSIDDIGSKNEPGGCWPSFLGHEVQGDSLLIKKSELDAGAYRFQ